MMKPRSALVHRLMWAFVSAGLGAAGMNSLAVADPAPAAAAMPGPKVLATVNGKKITEADLKIATDDLGSSVPQQLQGKARESYLLDYLIDSQLVVQKALSEKLDQTPEFTEKLAYMHDKALMDVLLGDTAKAATTNEMLHKIYDDAAKAQKPEIEIHARHILVPTEAEAQAVLKRLKAGEDFVKVAKEVSKDPSAEGGDLGWFTKDRMVPEFADAAFKLEPGQLSEPVKSQFGWHIIKLEGKREKQFPPFDEVKDQILRYAVQKAQSEMIVKLREGAKIERAEPATPPGDEMPPEPAPAQTPKPDGK